MPIGGVGNNDIGGQQIALLPGEGGVVAIDIEGQEAEIGRRIQLDVAGRQGLVTRADAQPERQVVAAVGPLW